MKVLSDEKYMELAKDASKNSRCAKKQLGCILVLTNGSWIEGTNGAPNPLLAYRTCPRTGENAISGQGQKLCKAVHAERQTLLVAAKYGYATEGSTLYSYMGAPCKDCCVELIEAGVAEIICYKHSYYDELSKEIIKEWVSKGGKFRFFITESII